MEVVPSPPYPGRKINLRSTYRLSILFFAVCILIGGCSRAPKPPKPEGPALPNTYRLALREAEQNAPKDELETAWKIDERIIFSGPEIKLLSRVALKQDGSILVLDNERRTAAAHTSNGTYLSALGGIGNEPASQVWPSDMTEAASESTAVSDFQGHRVNIFSKDRQFLSSFVYTPQNFSAQRIVYDRHSDVFYLFGNRWQTDNDGGITGADLLHKYTPKGEFLASYFPFPEKAKALDLYTYNTAAMDVDKGTIVIALPFDYTLYQLDQKGVLSVILKGEKTSFKAPTTALNTEKISPQDSYQNLQNWLTSWTPIVALVCVGDKVLVEYQTFDKLRYTVDVWSRTSKTIVKSIKTNRLMLTRSDDGYVYFLNNLENKGQSKYEILRTKLQF